MEKKVNFLNFAKRLKYMRTDPVSSLPVDDYVEEIVNDQKVKNENLFCSKIVSLLRIKTIF